MGRLGVYLFRCDMYIFTIYKTKSVWNTKHTRTSILRFLPFKFWFFGAALKCAPIMEWEFILASGRGSF